MAWYSSCMASAMPNRYASSSRIVLVDRAGGEGARSERGDEALDVAPSRARFSAATSDSIAAWPVNVTGAMHTRGGLAGPGAQPPPSGVLMNEPVTDELFVRGVEAGELVLVACAGAGRVPTGRPRWSWASGAGRASMPLSRSRMYPPKPCV